jgi:hypothetical protein
MKNVDEAIRRHCARPDHIQPISIPMAIHRNDLAWVAPHWIAKIEELREDEELADRLGHIAEMWAYALVAAESGLEHELAELAAFSTEDRDDLPLIHYCYNVTDGDGTWLWGKREYEPWAPIEHPPGIPRAARRLFELINERASATAPQAAKLD